MTQAVPAFLLGIAVGAFGVWLALQMEAPDPAEGDGAMRTAAPEAEAITLEGLPSSPPAFDLALERESPPAAAAADEAATAKMEPDAPAPEVNFLEAIRDSFHDSSTRGQRDYLALLQGLTPEEAPGLIPLFGELSRMGYPVAESERAFWQRWAEIDGEAASRTIFARDRRFRDTRLSRLAISTWAKEDPEAARAWLFSQDDIPLREGMAKGLIEGMAARDPAAAMRFLQSGGLSADQRAHGYAQVARQYHLQEGLDAVDRWSRDFPADDPDLASVIAATTAIYARASFVEALDWANSLTGPSAPAARAQLHARLAESRPDGLVAHLGRDPTAGSVNGVDLLTQRAVARWIGINPGAMALWLRRNRDIRNYDLVAAPFVEQIASQDPEAARIWAETLRDPVLRASLTDRFATGGSGADR